MCLQPFSSLFFCKNAVIGIVFCHILKSYAAKLSARVRESAAAVYIKHPLPVKYMHRFMKLQCRSMTEYDVFSRRHLGKWRQTVPYHKLFQVIAPHIFGFIKLLWRSMYQYEFSPINSYLQL